MPDNNTVRTVKKSKSVKIVHVAKAAQPVDDEFKSKQIGKDPFDKAAYEKGLQQPPYPLEQLVWIGEMHPAHSACIEQRAIDVVGGGWEWEPKNPEDQTPNIVHTPRSDPTTTEPAKPNPTRTREREERDLVNQQWPRTVVRKIHADATNEERDALDEKFRELAGGISMHELLTQVWKDYGTMAMGYLEVVRDTQGQVQRLYHVPAHTVRVHKDGHRYCQQRGSRKVWFVEWGSEVKIRASDGEQMADDATGEEVASELLVFRKNTSRSDFYGIPSYVSAIGWIMLALAARDYNIQFFRNLREPRWAIILSNLEGDDDMAKEIEEAFAVDLKEPHRNLIAQFEGEARAVFQKLSEDQNDASFVKLLELCDDHVFIAHRMPRDRVGMVKTGPLGGSVAEQANRTYREGVIVPDQEIVNHRLQEFVEKELGAEKWLIKMIELDAKAERSDLDGAMKGYRAGIYTLNEARARAGRPPITDEWGDRFIWELDEAASRAIKSREADPQNELLEAFDNRLKAISNAIETLDEG